MNVDHPTVTLYFVFALTYCKASVYTQDEAFVREVLLDSGVGKQDWRTEEDSESWQVFDSRVMAQLIHKALPRMVERRLRQAVSTITF